MPQITQAGGALALEIVAAPPPPQLPPGYGPGDPRFGLPQPPGVQNIPDPPKLLGGLTPAQRLELFQNILNDIRSGRTPPPDQVRAPGPSVGPPAPPTLAPQIDPNTGLPQQPPIAAQVGDPVNPDRALRALSQVRGADGRFEPTPRAIPIAQPAIPPGAPNVVPPAAPDPLPQASPSQDLKTLLAAILAGKSNAAAVSLAFLPPPAKDPNVGDLGNAAVLLGANFATGFQKAGPLGGVAQATLATGIVVIRAIGPDPTLSVDPPVKGDIALQIASNRLRDPINLPPDQLAALREANRLIKERGNTDLLRQFPELVIGPARDC